MPKPSFTLAKITRLTATEEGAFALAERLRWGGDPVCHHCASRNIARLAVRSGRYRCRGCAWQFSIRTGTPMEHSKLPLSIWLRAMWLVLSSSKGISSLRLGEMLGIQQKSAWFLSHRVRLMRAWAVRMPISGKVVELDEIYTGAPPRPKASGEPTGVKSGRGPRRPLVLTAPVRGGETRLKVIASHGKADIGPAVDEMVEDADIIMTDSLPAYSIIPGDRRSVKHSAKEFAWTDRDGVAVHVNRAESVHADLRRMVLGVHH